MSSNVGLSTPRGSGTSGYVQRNSALLKLRNTGYGAPTHPGPMDRPFKQRMPDKQILDHDRKRGIEVKVMEERERLEEENERIEEEQKKSSKTVKDKADKEEEEKEKVLSEEEIDERCDALRKRLLDELEVEMQRGEAFKRPLPAGNGKDRRNLKSYQVHELAEAKIEETERLRRAFGLREDRETGVISSSRDRYRERERRD
ncbi:mRNA splicing factor Cwf21 [Penicillium bovifimosum]|uniref:mRNA splicing factor Cwf21 n=1 Tax=Penicillium bovifimosum TaxID=126998 RepID=A0A9W9H680_9EURO|nr:mRNA splicing factor Cwf21 [Penicillium bovifimosum]KAJ5139308.1 mRNA splicing factor Cwf21 [Penicillium bovifimosum]